VVALDVPPERQAARVVVLDPSGAVLLLAGRDPTQPEAAPFWIVPGGGVANGEPVADAGRREVYEETGTRLDELGPPVWTRSADFVFDGRAYRQRETFFVVRARRFAVSPATWTEDERRFITGWRWWPLAELEVTGEVVYPSKLASLIGRWLVQGPPVSPETIV
jgi:8-oxo-dGTP pyrophosphatase MutT (NUDIX family)